jgi:hypothetical protein
MRGSLAASAAIPRIVRRRLQPRRRADTAVTSIYRRVQQFRKRGPDRLNLGAVSFGFRGFAGLLTGCLAG